ncbi:MAG: MarR family transcriptional regulator [Aeropyrum sp.]|nr:MarR family transcriptional regulator [Aeropyrum sp.]MCE4615799.1 MarR family transcriptional regulator [Aeropyrum sp.]
MVKNVEVYERRALDLIKRSSGILQSELWKRLGLDSREGSRIVLRLARKGIIRREQVVINGRKTYKLYPAEPSDRKEIRLIVNISSILDIPCTICPYIDECGKGGFYSPETCKLIDEWMYSFREE